MLLANSVVEQASLGRGLKSPLEEDPLTGDFKTLVGPDNVKQCIIDLILTRVGERVMNEDLGTELPSLIFETTDGVVDVLPLKVIDVIRRHEPRVTRVTAKAYVEELNGSATVVLDLSWVVKATGRPDNLVYPFYTDSNASAGVTDA